MKFQNHLVILALCAFLFCAALPGVAQEDALESLKEPGSVDLDEFKKQLGLGKNAGL